jgi:uroporphyrin-III C-methyltransferase
MTEQTPTEAPPPTATPAEAPRTAAGRGLSVLALLLSLVAVGVSGWQWLESRRISSGLEKDLAIRLAEIDGASRDARALSAGTRDVVRDAEARLGQLEARLAEMQNQRFALETLYQELSRSRDEWTLAEVEQILLIASQQLQLANNVKAALIALEAADARLARSDRPQLTQLRRVVARDIEQLKAAPFVDVTGMGLKIERVAEAVGGLPLAMEARPAASAPSGPDAAVVASGWRALVEELWRDLRSMVRIETSDSAEVPLLAPDQVFFLRENLKLRLLSARLALLSRDEKTFRADLGAAIGWLKRFYDGGSPAVVSATATLEQLSKSDIQIELPDVGASLDAVRNYRLVRERTVR